MFYNLNKHILLQLIISLLLLVWSAFAICTQMTLSPPQGSFLLYHIIYNYFCAHPIFTKVLAILMLLFELLFIHAFFSSNKFSENKTMMPVLFFLLCMNAGHFFNVLAPAHFTIFFLTLITMINNMRDTVDKPVKNQVFISGLLIGIATLIDVNALWLALFLLIFLAISRYSFFKELVILLAGMLIVCIYTFTVYFLSDKLPLLQESFHNLSFFGLIRKASTTPILEWVSVIYMLISIIAIITTLKIYYDNKLVVLRKRYLAIVLLWFILLFPMLSGNYSLSNGIIYLIFPITLFYSLLCDIKRRIVFHDLVILTMLVLLWI